MSGFSQRPPDTGFYQLLFTFKSRKASLRADSHYTILFGGKQSHVAFQHTLIAVFYGLFKMLTEQQWKNL